MGTRMKVAFRRAFVGAAAIGTAVVLAACGSSSKSSSSGNNSSTTGSSGSNNSASVNVDSFTSDFSAMGQLKDLAKSGKGLVGVLLPDTTTSARYESFDRPYLI